jgi:hypothetical protein
VKPFAAKQPGGVLWVQAAGDTRGQTWAGLFRDDDSNGVLEFAPLNNFHKKGRWTPELNFLQWQPFDAAAAPDLPEKARVRISIQWREPHDPELTNEADDPYREPVVNLGLVVLKQRDPTGTRLATDDLDVVARSNVPAVRLRKEMSSGTYEQSVEFEIISSGRFALRVEGRIPDTNRPATVPTLPTQRRRIEIRPRILVEVVDAPSLARGRIVFADFAASGNWPPLPEELPVQFGGVGMPADSRNLLTVGAVDSNGRLNPASAVGAGPGREMMIKPEALGPAFLDLGTTRKLGGTAIAASFNGGLTACLVGMDVPPQPKALYQLLNLTPGEFLRVPEVWVAPPGKR